MVRQVWLGLGSNIQPDYHLQQAILRLQEQMESVRLSSVYENEAYGFQGPVFYNMVAWVETKLSLEALQAWCKNIEIELGREPSSPKLSSKTLDIDILLYEEQVSEATKTQPKLPRSELLQRAFVLAPMAELSPYYCHPVQGDSYKELWKRFLVLNPQQHFIRVFSAIELLTD